MLAKINTGNVWNWQTHFWKPQVFLYQQLIGSRYTSKYIHNWDTNNYVAYLQTWWYDELNTKTLLLVIPIPCAFGTVYIPKLPSSRMIRNVLLNNDVVCKFTHTTLRGHFLKSPKYAIKINPKNCRANRALYRVKWLQKSQNFAFI